MPGIPSPIVAVATWSNDILLYTLDRLRSATPEVTTISEKYFATSLLFKQSTDTHASMSGTQLMAGLSDGSMIIYDIDMTGDAGTLIVKGRKASSLGTRPLRLCSTMTSANGEEKIMAVGLSERTSVIFEARDRIDFSAVSKKAGITLHIGALLTDNRTSLLLLVSAPNRSANALFSRMRTASVSQKSTASRSFKLKLSIYEKHRWENSSACLSTDYSASERQIEPWIRRLETCCNQAGLSYETKLRSSVCPTLVIFMSLTSSGSARRLTSRGP